MSDIAETPPPAAEQTPAAADGVLVLDHVSKNFGGKPAVRGLNLTVNKGEVFGFLGPNGAGKSTTIRMMLGVLGASSGHIKMFGTDIHEPGMRKRLHSRIGFLSGDMVLDSNLTGRQYLEFAGSQYVKQGKPAKGIRAKRDELAQLLQADLDVKIGSYSRGNRQKIGLIGAMQHQPDLLIFDEPTSGFDPLVQEHFAELVRAFKAAGGTVFMSSHVLAEVQQLCDRLAFIKDGVIIQVVEVAQLVQQSAKQVHIQVPAQQVTMLHGRIKTLPGVELLSTPKGSDGAAADLLCLYSGSPNVLIRLLTAFDVQSITIEDQELEDIFMRYYKQQMTRIGTPVGGNGADGTIDAKKPLMRELAE